MKVSSKLLQALLRETLSKAKVGYEILFTMLIEIQVNMTRPNNYNTESCDPITPINFLS